MHPGTAYMQNTSKTSIFTLWRVGKRARSPRTSRMHPGTAYMQNTSKTCIFTLWRVGKRAFLRILQWENGKIRQKRAFSPSGEWENVHFCALDRKSTRLNSS